MASASSRPPILPPISLLDPAAKDTFWLIIEDCLTLIHNIDTLTAIQQARATRISAEDVPADQIVDLIYHNEPFYVACDIAGIEDASDQDRLLMLHRKSYDAVLKRRGW